MDLSDFARLLRRHRLLVAGLLLLGGLVAATFAVLKPPAYTSTSKVFLSTATADSVAEFSQGATAVQQMMKSYAAVVGTPYVLDPVIRQLGLDESAESLASRIAVDSPTGTVVLDISVTDGSAVQSAQIANAISQNLSSALLRLNASGSSDVQVVAVDRLQAAAPPSSPTSPNVPQILAIGLLLGAAAGVAGAMLLERIDTKIRSVSDVESVTAHPVLGRVSLIAQSAFRPLIRIDGASSARAEEYRTLRTNLQFVHFEAPVHVIVVTSSIAGEGKSTTVANLGIVLAGTHRRVLLIDGDLRTPMLGETFGLESAIGLTDVLIGDVQLRDAVQRPRPDLDVLVSGAIPPNPSELLQSKRMLELLDQVGREYDMVLIDTPPVLPVSDAAILAKVTDGAIVVCAADRARRQQLQGSIGALEQIGAAVLGVVPTMLSKRTASTAELGIGRSLGSSGREAAA